MNVVVTRAAEGFPRRAFTVEDIRRMIDAGIIAEHERLELIEGDIVVLSPNVIAHDRIKSELSAAIIRRLSSNLTAGVSVTLQLRHDILVEPDIAIISRSVYEDDPKSFAQPRPEHVRLLIEIAVSSMAYDRRVKARLYARHGIAEYWVIDALERRTWVHTGPNGDGWASIVERGPTDTLTTPALPGLSIRLGEI